MYGKSQDEERDEGEVRQFVTLPKVPVEQQGQGPEDAEGRESTYRAVELVGGLDGSALCTEIARAHAKKACADPEHPFEQGSALGNLGDVVRNVRRERKIQARDPDAEAEAESANDEPRKATCHQR
ncbi:MAG: hypothetical protein QM784_11360 [Polyangiaceae bacterium]